MRRLNHKIFEIHTEDNGVLHFVIGSEYSGESKHGGTFGKRVTGILKHSVSYGLYISVDGDAYVIDTKTLRYL